MLGDGQGAMLGDGLELSTRAGGKSNPNEASLVARIVAGVLAAGELSADRVAILAPYSSQVDEVRAQLASTAASACRVGTVDSFQGQEVDLVVFSATRSNGMHEMGFLRDPRRLCVAITRARRGLILVGDVTTLRSSRHWAALVDSCDARGCLLDAEDLYGARA